MPALDPDDLERIFREESGRVVATLVRLFGDIDLAEEMAQEAFLVASERWPATGLPPNPGGWLTTTARNRGIDRLRREASRDDRHAQAALLHEQTESADPGARRARRPSPPDLHLLPPGARAERAGRAHAATARRARHARHRAGVHRPGADDGEAARARETQDPRREDPVPRPTRRRAPRAAPLGAERRLPRVQRGVHRDRRRRPRARRPLRGSHPTGAAARGAHARRVRGDRPAGAAPPHRGPARGPHRAGRLDGAAARPGPLALGSPS